MGTGDTRQVVLIVFQPQVRRALFLALTVLALKHGLWSLFILLDVWGAKASTILWSFDVLAAAICARATGRRAWLLAGVVALISMALTLSWNMLHVALGIPADFTGPQGVRVLAWIFLVNNAVVYTVTFVGVRALRRL
jgi:hypothetical protein